MLTVSVPDSPSFVLVATGTASATLTLTNASGTVGFNLAGEPAVRIEASGTDADVAAAMAAEFEVSGSPFTDYARVRASGHTLIVEATSAGPLGNLVSLTAVGAGVSASSPFLVGGSAVRVNL